ncbi:MAG: phosphoglycerate kinase [Cytophagales bacterium]|nr:MAG: phosphoglycerate kinase [Cytophagales bacterium]TAF62145.1 MAG: phosphoglycerate kinase [Cytophagales bacterium]
MITLHEYNFANQRALIRVDFNVPLNASLEITDSTRIDAALPTLRKILNDGGSLVIMSHLGRPKNGPEDKFSLKHLVPYLSKALQKEILFSDDCIGHDAQELSEGLRPGQVMLLENVRFYKEETKGDIDFAQQLAIHGDVYVNDAFGTAHRAHASTTQVASFFETKVAGFLMQAELENAQKVLYKATQPFVAIMGGAKISDKIQVIENLLPKVSSILIGGAMTYTFLKATGCEVGKSLVEEDKLELALSLIQKAQELGVKLLIPIDSVVAESFHNDAAHKVVASTEIPKDTMGLDIGPKTVKLFRDVILEAHTILWNGPMGVFEMPNFANGTQEIGRAIVEATQKGAYSLIGGGDSAAAINQMGMAKSVSYLSTGGGALLEYIEGKALPGVLALRS